MHISPSFWTKYDAFNTSLSLPKRFSPLVYFSFLNLACLSFSLFPSNYTSPFQFPRPFRDRPNNNMAVFVDLEDDDVDLPQPGHNGITPLWTGTGTVPAFESRADTAHVNKNEQQQQHDGEVPADHDDREEAAHESAVEEITRSMTVALGCYP